MTYNYIIFDKDTNQKIYQDTCTNRSKKETIEKAQKIISTNENKYYAVITSFDWQRGRRIIGRIN